jgi:SAM-dependent methyltransferase
MRNSSRTWLARENEQFARSIKPGSIVLDAGAGEQPYRGLFGHCTYEAADFEQVDKPYARSTYVCDLANIPVKGGRFDAVAFNQVMEHVPEPASVLSELHRVLKPGGRIICTAPLFYEEHEQPYDFFRYTQFAWRKLMGDAGFEIERLDWVEGYLGTVAYQLETASKYLPARPVGGLQGALAMPLMMGLKRAFKLLAAIFYRWDEARRHTASGYPKNYVCIARKPEAFPTAAVSAE